MAERITWQNVAAPDMRAAILGQVAAGDQLAKGFSTLGSTFKGVNEQNITDESNAAMLEAMKIQDPDAWNQMMATTGMAGLGVGPGRASAELMQFAEGYGANLDARRAAVDATNAAADTSRAADQRFDMNVTANDRLLVTNALDDRATNFNYDTSVKAADRLEVTNAQADIKFGQANDIYNKTLSDAARVQASQMAEQKLMQIPASEADNLRAMAEDGTIYQFLGISQDMVTPDLQALIYGRDEALTAAGRDEVTSKLAFDATKRTEDDRQLDERAAQIVAELSTSGVSSAADLAILADQYVNNLGGNNPRLMQAVLKALPNVNPAQFATSTEAGQAAQSTPEYVIATRGLESERNRFISANSTTPAMQAYVDGLTSFGSGENPVMGFIDEATTKISKTTPEGEPNAIYNETSASIQGTFNRLKANHAGVPDATIVSLMKRMVQGDGWIGDGDQLELMESQVSKTLDGMSTPEALANFERERSRVDTTLQGYENQQAAMDNLVAKIGLYETQGFTDKAEKAKAELLALTGSMEPTAEAEVQGPPVAPDDSLLSISDFGAGNNGARDANTNALMTQLQSGTNPTNQDLPPPPQLVLSPEEAAMTPRSGFTDPPMGDNEPLPEGIENAGLGTALADLINPSQFKDPANVKALVESGEITRVEAQIILRGSNAEVKKILRKVIANQKKNK